MRSAAGGTSGSDDFNRADGGLGAGWAAMNDGGLSIVSQQVVGTAGTAGDIRVAEGYGSDQSSQVQLTSTQLSGGQWVGPSVRSQNGGQDTYLGIYFWNNGSPQLRLYKRTGGTFTQLGSSYNSGPLPAGTKLTVSAVGSTMVKSMRPCWVSTRRTHTVTVSPSLTTSSTLLTGFLLSAEM